MDSVTIDGLWLGTSKRLEQNVGQLLRCAVAPTGGPGHLAAEWLAESVPKQASFAAAAALFGAVVRNASRPSIVRFVEHLAELSGAPGEGTTQDTILALAEKGAVLSEVAAALAPRTG